MSQQLQKDNTTLARKAALRLSLRKHLPPAPPVLETHGGRGHVYRAVYSDIEAGVVMESDPLKADHLAAQRPTWSVYQCRAELALDAGVGAHLEVGLLDVDPYGEPWPVLQAFFATERPRAKILGVAVNDGLRQKLRLQGGWSVGSMREAVQRFGNVDLRARYLEVCRFKLEQLAALAGYEVSSWTGYYCGFLNDMTHYAAVLRRRRRASAQRLAA